MAARTYTIVSGGFIVLNDCREPSARVPPPVPAFPLKRSGLRRKRRVPLLRTDELLPIQGGEDLLRRGSSERRNPPWSATSNLGLEVIVEEIRPEVHPAALTEQVVHRAKGLHREEPPFTMPALGPGIGEVDVESVDGQRGELVHECFSGVVNDAHVRQTPPVRLLLRLAAALLLDVDSDEQ